MNYGGIDSIILIGDQFYGFQATVASYHPTNINSLAKLLEEVQITEGSFNLVFVVPEDIFDDFKCQTFEAKGKKVKKGKFTNVKQWVLKYSFDL